MKLTLAQSFEDLELEWDFGLASCKEIQSLERAPGLRTRSSSGLKVVGFHVNTFEV